MCSEDLLCLGHSPGRKDLTLNSLFLIWGFIFSIGRVGIQVDGQGAIVNISDVFEGNQVAIFVKVKDFALGWVIKLNVLFFLVTFGGKYLEDGSCL